MYVHDEMDIPAYNQSHDDADKSNATDEESGHIVIVRLKVGFR